MIEIIATLSSAVAGLLSAIFVLKSIRSKKRKNSINIVTAGNHSPGKVSDTYTIKETQVGAVGDKATVEGGIHFHTDIKAEIKLESLSLELNKLREAMKAESKSVDQDAIIGIIAMAEMSALKGDQKETLSFLRKAGKWSLELSERIGLNVVSTAIKMSLGL
jgi:hypothetical protein